MSSFRICTIAVLISLAAGDVAMPAVAAKLYPVKPPDEYVDCPADDRRVEGAKRVLLRREGCEDGADEDFYIVEKSGKHKRLFGFVSLAQDATGVDWKGISHEAKSLPSRIGAHGLELWVTFEHRHSHSGNVCFPLGQRRYPIILFSFDDVPPPAVYGAHRFRRMSLSRIAAETRRVPRGGRANLKCDAKCCYPIQ